MWGRTEAGLGRITNRYLNTCFHRPPAPGQNPLLISKTFHWLTSPLAPSLTIPAGYSDGHPQVINTQEAASTSGLVEVPWEKPISWIFLREFITSICDSSELLSPCISCHRWCIWSPGHSFWVLPSGQQGSSLGRCSLWSVSNGLMGLSGLLQLWGQM